MKMETSLKIIFVINHSVLYGANKSLLNLMDGLIEQGVSPLLVMAREGDLCQELEFRRIPYKVIPHQFSIYPNVSHKRLQNYVSFVPKLLNSIIQNYIASRLLVQVAREFGADMIHTNIGPDYIGYEASKILGIPHVWHIREYQDLDFNMHPVPSKAKFISKLQSHNNYPIAITQGIFNHFSMQRNARVIYNGVLKKAQTRFVHNKQKYFLFVGRLEKCKGIYQLIEAFSDFAKFNRDYDLCVAGGGTNDFESGLYRKVDSTELSQRIHFLGFQHDVCNLMATATALIVPSFYEGFGRITAEAMFSGCLVIGNNSGGTKEILEKENLGILYSGQEELISAMKSVISNGIESYFPMIKKAQERAVTLYSQEQNVKSIYRYYTEILEN